MKLRADQLSGALARQLLPVYLITGDEHLLVDEAADAIRGAARGQGFDEREVKVAERGFDWDALAAGGANLSLFASRRMLELRIPNGKPGIKGSKALVQFAKTIDDDTRLLVFAPKLDRNSQNAAWVKALDKAGAHVQVWPVPIAQLPRWIAQRFARHGREATGEAVALIADRVQGNLLAAHQEVEKLLLVHEGGKIDADAVTASVADSSRFDVFELADAALAGNTTRAVRILEGLRGEGVEPTLIMWALTRELPVIAAALVAVEAGRNVDQYLRDTKVWPKRQELIKTAGRRVRNSGRAFRLLEIAAHTDQVVKGMATGKRWDSLLRLVQGICLPAQFAEAA